MAEEQSLLDTLMERYERIKGQWATIEQEKQAKEEEQRVRIICFFVAFVDDRFRKRKSAQQGRILLLSEFKVFGADIVLGST